MATVIDALTVTLGLDAAGFKKGQQETREALKATEGAATRTAKTMQAEGGRAAEFFTAAKVEALAFLGVLTGGAGLIAGFKDTAAGLNAINRAALASGESTQFIQAFSAAIGRTGGNIETAKQQLIQFAATVEQFKLRGGNSPLAQYSQVLGIDPTNAKPQEVIEGIMRAIERNPGPQGRQYILNMGAQLGVPNDLMLSLLQIGTLSNLQTAIQRSVELGAVQSEKQIDAAIKFQGAVVEFEQAITGLITSLIPFEALGEAIHNFTEYLIHPPRAATPDDVRRHLLETHPSEGMTTGRTLWQWFRGEQPTSAPTSTPPGGALPGPRTNPGDPRGIRNNNPLNLEYLPNQGATGSDGRFGIFPTMEAGVEAASRQIKLYRDRHGLTTVAGIVGRWAPAGENDPRAYAASVARSMGVDPNAPLNLDDPSVMAALIGGMARVENGRPIDPAAIRRGVGLPAAAPVAPAGSQPAYGGAPTLIGPVPYGVTPPSAPVSNSSDLTIHSMNINIPSGDPKHIAATVAQHLAREISNAANTGMA